MALNNFQKADRSRTEFHRAYSDAYSIIYSHQGRHNAYWHLNRADRLLIEAKRFAHKIRSDSDRVYMLDQIRADYFMLQDLINQ